MVTTAKFEDFTFFFYIKSIISRIYENNNYTFEIKTLLTYSAVHSQKIQDTGSFLRSQLGI